MSVQAFVDDAIASNKVVVFSKSYCPYCVKAKAALDGVVKGGRSGYKVFELDERSDGAAIQVRCRSQGDEGGSGYVPDFHSCGKTASPARGMAAMVKREKRKTRRPPTSALTLQKKKNTPTNTGLLGDPDRRVHRPARLYQPQILWRWG